MLHLLKHNINFGSLTMTAENAQYIAVPIAICPCWIVPYCNMPSASMPSPILDRRGNENVVIHYDNIENAFY